MDAIDLKKQAKHLYQPPTDRVVAVDVPEMRFLMVDGEGDPNTAPAFAEAVETLYALSYTLKFMVKKGPTPVDYGVMPLEGLWWADDMRTFTADDKSDWKWTAMIRQPDFITAELVEQAKEEVRRKKNPSALDKIRFAPFLEGKAAQIMHVGPFSEEAPNIEKVHDYIQKCGCQMVGKHHEIYLSDIRRGDPRNWKTVIRQPMG